jgi:hypothetical protein
VAPCNARVKHAGSVVNFDEVDEKMAAIADAGKLIRVRLRLFSHDYQHSISRTILIACPTSSKCLCRLQFVIVPPVEVLTSTRFVFVGPEFEYGHELANSDHLLESNRVGIRGIQFSICMFVYGDFDYDVCRSNAKESTLFVEYVAVSITSTRATFDYLRTAVHPATNGYRH